MKRKIYGLVLLGMLIFVQPSQATFGGLRIGGIVGLNILQGRHWYAGNPGSPNNDMVKRLAVYGGDYGVYGGYYFELGSSKFVIGAEAYYLRFSGNANVQLALLNGASEGSVNIKHVSSLGAAVVVGMMLNPKIFVYAKGGMETARFQMKYTFTIPGIQKNQTYNPVFHPLVPTIGGEYKFTSNLLIGLEVSYPFYKRFKANMSPPRAFHYKPVERRAMLRLTYLF